MKSFVSLLFCFLPICLVAQEECAFDFHYFTANLADDIPAFKVAGVETPMAHLEQKFQTFSLSSGDLADIFALDSGTLIDIPASAFLTAEGEVYKGKVNLYYREFNDPVSILLSGIPMTYKTSEGEELPMQSAGMFEIRAATESGETLFANPAQSIEVSLISTQTTDDFNYYEMEDETGEWVEKGKDEILTEIFFDYTNQASDKPFLGYSDIDIEFLKGRERKRGHNKFQFKLNIPRPTRSQRKEPNPYLYYTEYPTLKNPVWVYDGTVLNTDSIKQILRKIDLATWRASRPDIFISSKKLRKEMELIPGSFAAKEIEIKVNTEADNFLLNFYLEQDTVCIPVYPLRNFENLATEQKRNVKYFEKYLSLREARKPLWKRKTAINKVALIFYEKQQELHRERMKSPENGLNTGKFGGALSRRSSRVLSFGLCNIDRLRLLEKNKEDLLVDAFDIEGIKLKIESCIIWDEDNNLMFTYSNNKIKLAESMQRNSMTLLLENGRVALVSSAELKRAYQNKEGKYLSLVVQPKPEEKISKSDVAELLAEL